jgi:hypothetical protein
MDPPVGPEVVNALRRLPIGYHGLFARVLDAVSPDIRVRAVWLGGSVGRGVADAGSDLDVVLTVSDDAYDEFCAAWPQWLAAVTPTIIAREIPGLRGSFYSVTPGCERFDVVVERVGSLDPAALGARIAGLDRDGLAAFASAASASTRTVDPSGPGPEPARLAGIVEEFFRQQAIFPAAVVARQDWLLGVVGVVTTQRLLYDLFVEANQPLPVMGIKQWSARLTVAQRELLEALPVPDPRPAAVVSAMLAVRRAMLTTGRETAERCGVTWPVALDEAVARYFAKELGDSSASTSLTTRIDSPGE